MEGYIIVCIILLLVTFNLLNSSGKSKSKVDKSRACSRCSSHDVDCGSHWNGGYNLLCTQAIGRKGWYCNECGKITWEQSDDEYEANLSEWCVSHREIGQLKASGAWEAAQKYKKVTRNKSENCTHYGEKLRDIIA